MKPQVLLVALAILAVVAALPLGRAQLSASASAWPCCDTCGACTRSFPPQCMCGDTSLDGCHPKCEKCVKSSEDGTDVFHCADRITNFCKHRCTPAGGRVI